MDYNTESRFPEHMTRYYSLEVNSQRNIHGEVALHTTVSRGINNDLQPDNLEVLGSAEMQILLLVNHSE